ncbi:hypothetical protein Ahy_A07g033592 [Arachis hypogaea]|uniref:J domain-containing protein n=1 Tax=Arachis hypogaea TaxID=3818 RepID=A0A445C9P5_ARAHY|nr:hypothetical protein Ahy_A07g033592 [Arachis hypogaea]
MDIFDTFPQVSMWGDNFKVDGGLINSITSPMLLVSTSTMAMDNKPEYVPHELREQSRQNQEATNKDVSKVLRRLAQNREAARKSRLRKKAYVQQLETSRLKLMQLEEEIVKAKKQSMYIGNNPLDASYMGSSGSLNSGIVLFEIEYGNWIEEQHKLNEELRNAFQTQAPDEQLNQLIQTLLNHYSNLFKMKSDAAKADIFYLISGVWKSSAERLFLWIGGSRPSQLLSIIVPQLEPLTEQQTASISRLRLSSQQAEDALSQGLDKLQQSLVHNIAVDPLVAGNFGFQMADSIEKIEGLEGFLNQADHLRQQTLIHMSRILTTHQAAQGLLALGQYLQRLRSLSSLWASRLTHCSSLLSLLADTSFKPGLLLFGTLIAIPVFPLSRYTLPGSSIPGVLAGLDYGFALIRGELWPRLQIGTNNDPRMKPLLLLNSMHLGLSPSFVNGWLCSGVNDVSLCCRKRIGMEKFPWILVLTVDSSIDYAETTELDRDADEEQIKSAYRRLAKFYHPDVYDGRGSLEEGETAEARFIKIQAAYELLIDDEKRRQYDMDNRVNPMKASEAWMEWLMKKRKAFAQRGDMAVAAWAEQQQRQLNLRVRQLSRSKMDPDEARKILAREKAAAAKNFSNTLKRHTLVLKKRDLMRRKAEQDQDKLISQLLAAEGLESDTDE